MPNRDPRIRPRPKRHQRRVLQSLQRVGDKSDHQSLRILKQCEILMPWCLERDLGRSANSMAMPINFSTWAAGKNGFHHSGQRGWKMSYPKLAINIHQSILQGMCGSLTKCGLCNLGEEGCSPQGLRTLGMVVIMCCSGCVSYHRVGWRGVWPQVISLQDARTTSSSWVEAFLLFYSNFPMWNLGPVSKIVL